MATTAVNAAPNRYLPTDHLWPHVPDGWIVGTGHGWVAIDKPTEVPESSSRGHGGDLLTRWDNARAPDSSSPPQQPWRPLFSSIVGGQARAQRSALSSGVVVLTDAPQGLGGAERQRSEQDRFVHVAGVIGWPGLDGRAAAGLGAGLGAVGIHCRALRHKHNRSLLELTTADDSANVIDALEKLGFAVAGDPQSKSGEALCARMMLHRLSATWSDGKVEAPLPDAMTRWLDGEREQPNARLKRALRRRYGLAHLTDTNCFRVIDDESDITIDRYGHDIVLSSYADLPDVGRESGALDKLIAAECARATRLGKALNARSTYLKIRPRQANTVVDAHGAGLTPKEPISGPTPTSDQGIVVQENGVRFWVRLGAGLGTGLFLDQRDNRRWVRDRADGMRVLNTFAYTCAFSVAAAVGGARRTVSIDAARPALELGRANLVLNGIDDEERHDIIRGDVFKWLPRMARRGDRFDMVILDPPSYSSVRKHRFSALKDYGDLVETALSVLDSNGWLLASVNHTKMTQRRLSQLVHDACKRSRRSVIRVDHRMPGIDHPSGRMKAIAVQVD